MYKHENAYPVYTPAGIQEIIGMRIIPDEILDDFVYGRTDPFSKAELIQLKRGVKYSGAVSDTQKNRENLAFKMTCYQIIAYNQGWKFNPENYQIRFIPLGTIGTNARIYQFEKNAQSPFDVLSPGNKAGFYIDPDLGARRMDDEDADDLGCKIIRMFPRN